MGAVVAEQEEWIRRLCRNGNKSRMKGKSDGEEYEIISIVDIILVGGDVRGFKCG